jgi:hypothetical protein
MRFVYIVLKTPLVNNCIRTEATHDGGQSFPYAWQLRSVGTGDVILTLPAAIQELRRDMGTIYEDDAIRVYT